MSCWKKNTVLFKKTRLICCPNPPNFEEKPFFFSSNLLDREGKDMKRSL